LAKKAKGRLWLRARFHAGLIVQRVKFSEKLWLLLWVDERVVSWGIRTLTLVAIQWRTTLLGSHLHLGRALGCWYRVCLKYAFVKIP